MDFESILWIIIFLIYLASIILKRTFRAFKAKKKAAAKTPLGWKQKLARFQSQVQGKFGGLMNQIQQEMEAAKQKDPEKETGWEKLLPPKDDEPVPVSKETEMMDVSPKPSRKIVREGVAVGWKEKIDRLQTRIQDETDGFLSQMMDEYDPSPAPKEIEKDVIPKDAEPERQDIIYQERAQPVQTDPAFKPEPSVEKEPAVSETEVLVNDLPYAIRDLRRAVIWSEILAPPVALRDE
ncbi:MAG: hypothetical protein JSW04_10825 [Desulfobacterales bacterium]|nr:MAG: hypothetical protein JSV38_01460 [Desulfobacterales bacterium]UCD88935.1 MAG: hypothetical protein JSW04_10825 [Desulfobacterales bacterium]